MRGAVLFLLTTGLFSLLGCENFPQRPPVDPDPGRGIPQPAEPEPVRFAEYETEFEDDLSASGIASLLVRAGSGSLTIVGDPATASLTAVGEVYTSAENREAAKRIGKELRFRFTSRDTQNPELIMPEPSLLEGQSYRVDLTIRIPESLKLTVDNSSGDVQITGFRQGLHLTSAVNSVTVRDVDGGVTVRSSGTDCAIEQVTGLIDIQDGSGDLTVQFVTGEVRVRDERGELLVAGVDGDVTARNNPGRPKFINIEGSLTLSGIAHDQVTIDGVSGSVVFSASGN